MSFIFYDNTKKRYVLSYSVSTPSGKKRKRLFFKTKKLATEAKRTHDSNQKSYGKVSSFDLNKYQQFLMLEEYADGIDLIKAVDHYKETYRVATERKFESIVEPFIEHKKNLNVSPEWVITIRGYLEKLKANFRNARIDKINRIDLEEFISNLPHSVSYKDNVRRVTKDLFKYAESVGWCKVNPAKDLAPYKNINKKILFMGCGNVIKLFKYLETNRPELIPFNAIRAFFGMRTSHVKRLTWDNINFEDQGIRVQDKGKSDLDYLQGYPENGWQWLAKYKRHPINFSNVDRMSGEVIRELNIEYPRNGFRHAFATYHLSLFKDAGITSYLIQHKESNRTLYKHYKGLSSEKDATTYFSIIPRT
jgi:integrase